jgi:hypothetical protein
MYGRSVPSGAGDTATWLTPCDGKPVIVVPVIVTLKGPTFTGAGEESCLVVGL